MKTIVLDSFALLAYFEDERDARIVSSLFQESAEGRVRLIMNVVNWGEIVYITLREYGPEYADKVENALSELPVEVEPADKSITKKAAKWKARGGLSYADCFVLATADRHHGEIVTGDPEFRKAQTHFPIIWLKKDEGK